MVYKRKLGGLEKMSDKLHEYLKERFLFLFDDSNGLFSLLDDCDDFSIKAYFMVELLKNYGRIQRTIKYVSNFSHYQQRANDLDKKIIDRAKHDVIAHILPHIKERIKKVDSTLDDYLNYLNKLAPEQIEDIETNMEISDLALHNVIIERDNIGLVIEEIEKRKWGSKAQIREVKNKLNRLDKRLKEQFVLPPGLKVFLDNYRASFGMKEAGKYWWLDMKAIDEVAAKELAPFFEKVRAVKKFYTPTKECKRFDEHIIAGYVYKTLPDDMRREFEKHLKSCNYCLNQILEVSHTKEVFAKAELRMTKELEEILKKAKEKSQRAKEKVKGLTAVIIVKYSKRGLIIIIKEGKFLVVAPHYLRPRFLARFPGIIASSIIAGAGVTRGLVAEATLRDQNVISEEVDNRRIEITLSQRKERKECEIRVSVRDKKTKKELKDIRVFLYKNAREIESIVTEKKNSFDELAGIGKYKLIFKEHDKRFAEVELSFQEMEVSK